MSDESNPREALPKCPACGGMGWWRDKDDLLHDCEACRTTGHAVFMELAAANARIAALETLARKLYSLAYEREFDHDSGHQTRSECRYCGQVSNMDTRVEHDLSEGGCFVADAKALLGEDGHG